MNKYVYIKYYICFKEKRGKGIIVKGSTSYKTKKRK